MTRVFKTTRLLPILDIDGKLAAVNTDARARDAQAWPSRASSKQEKRNYFRKPSILQALSAIGARAALDQGRVGTINVDNNARLGVRPGISPATRKHSVTPWCWRVCEPSRYRMMI
jgi:hypothetical protein